MLSALVCTGKFYLSTAPRHTHTHTCSQNREERSRKEEPILMTTAAPGWAQTALSVLYVELHLVSQQQELTLLKACFLLFHQPHSSSAADRTNSYKITSSFVFLTICSSEISGFCLCRASPRWKRSRWGLGCSVFTFNWRLEESFWRFC